MHRSSSRPRQVVRRGLRPACWLRLFWALASIVSLLALGACGGRSDQDALAGESDANLGTRDTGSKADAPADALDASVVDAADVSVDVAPPSDSGLDAIADRRIDATVDSGRDGGVRVLVSIATTPPAATLARGTKVSLTVTGTYSDATTADLTASATFASNAPMVATVNANVVTAVTPGRAVVTARVNGLTSTTAITVTPATIVSIAVTPATASVGVGGTVQYTAVATLSDGTHQDVTLSATWVSNSAIAAVSATGLARAVAPGMATIRATVMAVTGSATLTVTPAALVSIAVTPTNPVVGVGVTIPFRATATYADGSIADVTTTVLWSSSDPRVLSIALGGGATTLAPGTSIVTASLMGTAIAGTTTVTVTPATLVSIAVTPISSTLAVGGTVQLAARGTYSDMTTADITASVTWSSDMAGVAFVSNAAGSNGLVTALGAGGAVITATLGSVSGAAKVVVTAAMLVRIDITPVNPSVPLATSLSLKAQGTYSDGSSIDITTSVTWSTDDPTIASISNAPGTQGRVTGNALGMTTARARLGAVTGTTNVTVTSAVLVSILVTPANSSIDVGIRQPMTATGVYSDMSTVDLTTTAVWTTGSANVATVSNASGAEGQLTATGAGTTTVTATVNAIKGSTNVTVTTPTLSQLVVQPINPTNRVGENRQFAAIAIFSNGTQQNVTGRAMWSSSNTTVATIGPMGQATARAVGTTTITATFQGLTGSTTLTVTNAVPVSISVTPIAPSVAAGTNVQFQATAIFSDNSTQNVTNQATWTSSNTAVAAIATAGPGRGNARTQTAGSTTITATWQGLTDSTTLTVTAAVPVSISVAPASATVAVGTNVPFTATLIYSDGTSRAITGQATWTSSDPSVAAITTGGGNRGQATALSEGMTTIEASFQGITGSASMTVTTATLTRIQVTPFSPTLFVGFVTPFAATGIYSDNSTRDLTQLATWTSTADNVAAVSNAMATRGQVTPLAAGMATISATYQGVTGTDDVTVSDATLSSITVTPAMAMVAPQTSLQYTAMGRFSNGASMDITNYVTWLSSDTQVADVSNAATSRGLAKSFATGTTAISATRGPLTGSTSLFVQ